MNKALQIISMCLLFSVMLAACNSQENHQSLNMEDSGKTISLNTGDIIDINLDGNPTTGFAWDIANLDEGILEPQGEAEYQSSSDALGAGGAFTLTFKAVNKGSTQLELVYHQPWEESDEPADTFQINIEVK